ncbi:TetR/AcrR family transcriptional regulator [Paeniglutamicibacter psychrophenolicus]|uniref:TetR/AcrR family transcriptional regulator n=1 Tax=Paeniglutamicibacter psychrophenolicus TaxID=257454 RepID=UPI00278A658F|nr:TetR/AcrR family transcriptional regulator [Paeniglutamicibacter psychrophenolicus]MDQ0094084.1 AcrR family transcriptional regulator [Paeniglutamicibacter psychrophenolicus]
MPTVKSSRGYDSSSRRAAAQKTRDAILDAAQKLLLARGYPGTTIARIAADARVSVETIYKSFGGKPGLVRAIYERGLRGRGPVAAFDRSDDMRTSAADAQSLMRAWGELTAEVAESLTPILLLVRSAAATDAGMAELQEQSNAERLQRMEHNARFLQERGYLRGDVALEEAVDVMWLHSSPELYELLVLQRGWSTARFARYVARSMASALVRPAPGGD